MSVGAGGPPHWAVVALQLSFTRRVAPHRDHVRPPAPVGWELCQERLIELFLALQARLNMPVAETQGLAFGDRGLEKSGLSRFSARSVRGLGPTSLLQLLTMIEANGWT